MLIVTGNTISVFDLNPVEAAYQVREEFIYGYNAYIEYANTYDRLNPFYRNGSNLGRYSLLYTPIDALDTMYIMNLTDLTQETLKLICNYRNKDLFNVNMTVSMFNTVISLLGGLLSSYHLIQDECLKNLAIDLGERLMPVFTTKSPSGSNWLLVNLQTGVVNKEQGFIVDLAGLTTNIVEFGALSYVSKNMTYFKTAKNVLNYFYNHRSDIGFVGQQFQINSSISNLETLWPIDKTHIDAGIDSYYESQIKCWKLFNDSDCKLWWKHANSSIMKYLKYYQNIDDATLLWFRRINMFNGSEYNESGWYDLYSAYFAAELALAGNLKLAKQNQEANWFMWNKSNIEPGIYDFLNITDPQSDYSLNPENIESNYYLYMITNDTLYLNRAYIYLNDLISFCKCDNNTTECVGYTGLANVNTKQKQNDCPEFFFAETLKYLYLTFLRNEKKNPLIFDDYIFNTESHPIPKSWGKWVYQQLQQ